jgi:hypothetical protein
MPRNAAATKLRALVILQAPLSDSVPWVIPRADPYRLLPRRERAYVVDVLVVENAAVESRHHRWREGALDHGEDFAVGRAVVPLIIGEVPRA